MTDDLVKRLRAVGGLRHDGATRWYVNPDGPEAATRIEQLKEALRKIACDGEPYDKCHCVNSDECSYGIARSALGEKKDE